MDKGKSDVRSAEEEFREAQQRLAEAQQRAMEAGQGLTAAKMRDVPSMEVEVLPGQVVAHEDKTYHGADYPVLHGRDYGTSLVLDGPTALALAMAGHVRIVRSAE